MAHNTDWKTELILLPGHLLMLILDQCAYEGPGDEFWLKLPLFPKRHVCVRKLNIR